MKLREFVKVVNKNAVVVIKDLRTEEYARVYGIGRLLAFCSPLLLKEVDSIQVEEDGTFIIMVK